MKNPKELIGKKVRGFKFEGPLYKKNMDAFIGKVGIIKEYAEDDFRVKFECSYRWYPADQIESHLVEEEKHYLTPITELIDLVNNRSSNSVKTIFNEQEIDFWKNKEKEYFSIKSEENEIPTLTDGVAMWVSHNDIAYEIGEVFFKHDGKYYVKRGLSFEPCYYVKQIKPIQTKEEQITAILGSSEKVAEIMELFKND